MPQTFLSTLSLRRATEPGGRAAVRRDFYPRSPCGERRPTVPRMPSAGPIFLSTLSLRRATFTFPLFLRQAASISIHALLAESDFCCFYLPWVTLQFLSTLSLRRATVENGEIAAVRIISIHALLAESDLPPRRAIRYKIISIHALLAESDSGRHH